MNDITSTAFNFGKQFSTGVNARTGMYQVSISIGNMPQLGGNELALQLSYNFMSNLDEGFGEGWSLNLSRYDIGNKHLILSDGRSYRVRTSNFRPDVECQYLKLKNFRVLYLDGLLRVIHKDGTLEQFDAQGYLAAIIKPSGHTLTFEYRMRKLQRIYDQAGHEICITYSAYGATVTRADGHNVVIRISNKRISRVTLADDTYYSLTYRTFNGMSVIEYLYHPMGATEKLTYKADGIRLPPGGPFRGLPAVMTHDIYGPHVEKMRRTYRYSTNNFLGFGLSRYTEDVDNLFETPHDYQYTCTEAIGDKEITQTYNKYHLLVEEHLRDLTTNTVIKTETVAYYCNTRNDFDAQPPQFLLPRTTTVTYYDNAGHSRQEVTSFEYDEFGNETSKTDTYGITTSLVFYAANGEDGAPVSRSGFPHLLKEKTITPSARHALGGEPNAVTAYRYLDFPSLNEGESYPLPESESTAVGGYTSSRLWEYLNTPHSPLLHGLTALITVTEGETTQTKTYAYQLSEDTIETQFTLRSLGVPDTVTTVLTHIPTGHELASTNAFGIKQQTEYDPLGRITKEVHRAETEYEVSANYHYTLGDTNELMISVSDGTAKKTVFDGLGRAIEQYSTDTQGQLVLFQRKTYNALGQVAAETAYDTFDGRTVSAKTTFEYDLFDEVCKKTSPMGVSDIIQRDRVKNKTVAFQEAEGEQTASVTAHMNVLGEVIRVQYPDYETTETFDGLGRLVRKRNAWGIETEYTLDDIGRPAQEAHKATERLTITKTFNHRNNQDQVTKINVGGIVVGERDYDSIGRLLYEKKGTFTTTYKYDHVSETPTLVTLPDGGIINTTIHPVLQETEHFTTSDGESGSFVFEKPSGRIISSTNPHFTLKKEYYINGLLKSETQLGKTVQYTYSAAGRLMTLQGYWGQREAYSYDNYHRVSKITSEGTVVYLDYDAFSRVKKETITSTYNPTIINQYFFDNQSRLTKKFTLVEGALYLSEGYEYKYNLISQKNALNQFGQATVERYEYDDFNRVTVYRVSGVQSPQYHNLGKITEQRFRFDVLGNITHVITHFMSKSGPDMDEATYVYDDGHLLIAITHSHSQMPNASLSYDCNGNLIEDDQSRRYQYNTLGQVLEAKDHNDNILSQYKYSAGGTQLQQVLPNQDAISLFYSQGKLVSEFQGSSHSVLFKIGGKTISRILHHEGERREVGIISDHKNSCIVEIDRYQRQSVIYTPYGEQSCG